MKLILENWKKYLHEAKFENEATKMVRDVVKNIKDHLRAYDGEPRIKPRFGELEHPLETIVYDKKYFGGLPDTLADQGINKVTFALEVKPSTAFGEGKKFGVDGKTFTYDDDFGKGEIVKDRQVRVNVYLSDEFTIKDMSSLIEKMKDTAVHEITHGGQSTDVLRKSGQAQMKAFQHGLTSLEALRLYYLEPAETEAYARGVYKRAKMSKVPFTTKLDEQIKELLGFYAHPKTLEKRTTQYTEEEVNNFFKNEYRQSIIDYANETLPAAVMKERDYQKDSEAIKTHSKRKKKLIGLGKNKTKAAPFTKKASTKRSKSAPPGFGELSEDEKFRLPPEIYDGTGNDEDEALLVKGIPMTELVMLKQQGERALRDILVKMEPSLTQGLPVLWYDLDKEQLIVDDGNHRIFQQWLAGANTFDAMVYSSHWHSQLRSVYEGEERFSWDEGYREDL